MFNQVSAKKRDTTLEDLNIRVNVKRQPGKAKVRERERCWLEAPIFLTTSEVYLASIEISP